MTRLVKKLSLVRIISKIGSQANYLFKVSLFAGFLHVRFRLTSRSIKYISTYGKVRANNNRILPKAVVFGTAVSIHLFGCAVPRRINARISSFSNSIVSLYDTHISGRGYRKANKKVANPFILLDPLNYADGYILHVL
jgi:hypothetical protein